MATPHTAPAAISPMEELSSFVLASSSDWVNPGIIEMWLVLDAVGRNSDGRVDSRDLTGVGDSASAAAC